MSPLLVNTLQYAQYFRDHGFKESEAKALAEKFGELGDGQLVTKEYLDMKLGEFDHKFKELESTLTIRLGAWIAAIITFFKVMEKFI